MKILEKVKILVKPKDVFPWIAQPDKAMQWQKDIKSSEVIKETPEKIGTTFTETVEDNGKSLVMQGQITNYIQDKLMSFHIESKVHNFDVTYSLEEQNNATKLIVDLNIRWKFPINIASVIFRRKMKDNIRQNIIAELQELKRLCEN